MVDAALTAPRALQEQDGKLNLTRTLLLSLPFAWISIFNAVLDNGLPVILTAPASEGGLELSFTFKGAVMAMDNILGLFLLPLFGWLSDRSRSKWGKRTPFTVAGGALAALLWVVTGIALQMQIKWIFFVLLTGALASIAVSRPTGLAILPDFTPLRHRRTAQAVTDIVSILCTVIGIVLILIFAPLGYDKIFFAAAALMLPMIAVFLCTVKERKWQAEEPRAKIVAAEGAPLRLKRRWLLLGAVFFFYVAYNGLVSSLSNYAVDVLRLSKQQFVLPQGLTLLAAVAFSLPAVALAKRMRRKILLILGVGTMVAAFALAGLQPTLNAGMFICFFFTGAGFAVALTNLYPFLLEMSSPDKIGAATGVFNMVMTLAMVVTPIASGWLSDHAPMGLKVLFPYCIGSLLVCLLFLILIPERKKATV
ncbi:MAG: MFS transporter [Oscillospiraceae bacterium]|jgi:MFS family permease|nr:MFS transporter [Oscillospiraceae bacterium]